MNTQSRAATDVQDYSQPDPSGWPPRPANEVFPELLDTPLVAQYLLYDRRGMTPVQARRNVRKLVKDAGLPTLSRIGSTLIFRKDAILTWLEGRGADLDGNTDDDTLEST